MDGRPYRDRLVRALKAGRPVPKDVADWLVGGFAMFEAGESLAYALGLRTTVELRAARDQWLEAAARAMPSEWPATVRANQVRRALAMLDQTRPTGEELLDIPAWQRHLAQARRCAALPGPRQLRRILAI